MQKLGPEMSLYTNDYIVQIYIVYEDFIEFGTATAKQRQKTQKVQEDKMLVFQKNS